MKKFVAIFISFILIFNFVVPSYAKTIYEGLTEVDATTPLKPGGASSEYGDDYIKDEGDGNSGESHGTFKKVLDIFNRFAETLLTPLIWLTVKMPTIDGSIWAQQNTFQLSFFSGTDKGFAGSIQSIIGGLYNALRYMVAAIYVIILVYLGIRMILSSIGKQKAHYKTLLQYWLTGLLLLFAFHWVMAFTIWTSDTITKMFADTGVQQIKSISNDLSIDVLDIGKPENVTEYLIALILKTDEGSIWTLFSFPVKLILLIALIAFGVFIIITYMKRFFTVALLIVLFPLVVLSYVFDKIGDRRAQTFSTWFREFTVNVFVQPIHALLLLLISFLLGLDYIKETPVIGAVLALLLLILIPIGEKQVKTLFQISSNMGPGSTGLGGALSTIAHAGMAANSLKKFGASSMEGIKNTKNLISAHNFRRHTLKDAEKSAKDNYKKMNPNASHKELKKEIKSARASKKKNLKDDVRYQQKMKELTGSKSLARGTAMAVAKAPLNFAGKSVGAGIGLGKALATTNNLDDLVPNIAGATVAGALAGSFVMRKAFASGTNIINSLSSNISVEVQEAEKLSKGNLDNLSDAERKHIAKVVNLDESLINNSNKGYIKSRLDTRKMAEKYGIKYDDPLVNALESDSEQTGMLKSGFDPFTGEKINIKDYKTALTKDALYLSHKATGQVFKLNGMGNKNASEDFIWHDGSDEYEKFTKELDKRAETYANGLRDTFTSESEYNKYLGNKKLEFKKHANAENDVVSKLVNSTHTILKKPPVKMYESIEKRFETTDDYRDNFSAAELTKINSSAPTYADDMIFDPTSAESKANIIRKTSAMEKAGLPILIDQICKNAGCTYTEFKNGTISDTQFKTIANDIQQEYKNAPEDIQRTVMANIVDMENRANNTISESFNNGYLSEESKRNIIGNMTGDYTSNGIKNFLNNLNTQTIETKLNAIDAFNIYQDAEHTVMPHTATIINASKEGKINTPVEIPNFDMSQLGTTFSAGEKVKIDVKPDSKTGEFRTIVTSISDPSKTVTINSNINTGASDLSASYAGEFSSDNNGNLELLRSNEELDYSFESAEDGSPFSINEIYSEFTISDLQTFKSVAYSTSSSDEYTIIKNADICVILDSNNQIIAVKEGMPMATDKLTQFNIKANSAGEFEITSNPFANVEIQNKVRLDLYCRDTTNSADDIKLIKRLLGKN